MKKIILATTVALLMVGCGKEAPSCDDSDSKELVVQIAIDKYTKVLMPMIAQANLPSDNVWSLMMESYKKITIKNIRTDSSNDELEQSTCKAQIEKPGYTMPLGDGKTVEQPGRVVDITYKLSKTSDGELFTEVYGLPSTF